MCHYPPGTSKWNRIEHRLFSYLAMNSRGRPLVSLATVVSLIAATTTRKRLRVRAEIDKRSYPKGVIVPDEQMETDPALAPRVSRRLELLQLHHPAHVGQPL